MNEDRVTNFSRSSRFPRSRYSVGLIVLGAVAVYFLLSEHRAHALGALPYLLLLACPLMHIFMHRGHGGQGTGHHGHSARDPGTRAQDPGAGEMS